MTVVFFQFQSKCCSSILVFVGWTKYHFFTSSCHGFHRILENLVDENSASIEYVFIIDNNFNTQSKKLVKLSYSKFWSSTRIFNFTDLNTILPKMHSFQPNSTNQRLLPTFQLISFDSKWFSNENWIQEMTTKRVRYGRQRTVILLLQDGQTILDLFQKVWNHEKKKKKSVNNKFYIFRFNKNDWKYSIEIFLTME